jgi:hypothetical protein
MHILLGPRGHPPTIGTLNSKQTLIVICVAGSVGGLLIILLTTRMLRMLFCRRRSAPLPPIQPLAHEREQLAQLLTQNDHPAVSPTNWHEPQHLTPPVFASRSGSGSDVSLLRREPSDTSRGSPHASLGYSAEDVITLSNTTPLDASPLSFTERPAELTDLNSSSPTTPQSNSSCTNSTQNAAGRPRPRVSSHSRPRPRPVSMISNASTAKSARTSRTIRGAPHDPQNNVEIVLPTPLAPTLHNYMINDGILRRQSSSIEGFASRRTSIVDKWAPVPVRSSSGRPRSTSFS